MDSSDLTPEQCQALRDQLCPMLRYLSAAGSRLSRGRQVRQLAEAAHDAVFSLNVELHYLSCEHGVGKRPRDGG
jgi:hypothetical protein